MATFSSRYHVSETLTYPYTGKIIAILGPMFSAKCFGLDVVLMTPTGPLAVANITKGTVITTTMGPSPVLDVYNIETDCVRITELDGRSHIVSTEHMVPVSDDGRLRLVLAGHLCSYGDRQPLVSGVTMVRSGGGRIGFTAETAGRHPTRGLVMAPGYQYLVLESGALTHNSSALTEELERQRIAKRNIALIRPVIDGRYDDLSVQGGLVLHSGKEYARATMFRAAKLSDLDLETLMNYDVIGVDEIGMFDDVLTVVEWANLGKRVVVCGIVGDYKLMNFRNVHMLLPHCETIIHQSAVCTQCGRAGRFSKRITSEMDSLVVGGQDKYTALCRKCYYTWEK